ncbi:MAG: SBBP repeat-containing protein, partial [Hormoscilla sp. SP12CHS1]|nr:SBBP repeat-containing protein [Hormoscilla sp. SP12CHS1]
MISIFKPNTIVVTIDTGVENYQQLIDGVTTGKVNLPPALKTEVMATYSGVFNLEIALNIGHDEGLGIATDSDGNVWVTGFFEDDIDGDGNNDLTSNGEQDSYVAKFDSNGDLLLALNIGGSSRDYGHSIAIDNNDNVWVTGFFNSSSIDIDGDGNNDLTSNGLFDSYV